MHRIARIVESQQWLGKTSQQFVQLCAMVTLFTDSEKSPLTPLCIEDAERVEDPILFERYYVCNRENAHWGLRAPSR